MILDSTPNNWPPFFNFLIRLQLDLGYKALIFASSTNLDSVPRFADICCLKLEKVVANASQTFTIVWTHFFLVYIQRRRPKNRQSPNFAIWTSKMDSLTPKTMKKSPKKIKIWQSSTKLLQTHFFASLVTFGLFSMLFGHF